MHRFQRTAKFLSVLLLSVIVADGWEHESAARADILYLNHGGQVEGDLLNPDQSPRQSYLLKTAEGVKLTVPASQVERVVVKSEAERKYEAFAARLPDTAAAHFDAAEKCAKAGLAEQRTFHLEQVLRLEPDHETARHALGYSRVEGKWTRQDEAMEAKGYIRVGGTWRLPQELELNSASSEFEQKEVQWRKDLKKWRDWIIKLRDPQKTVQGEQSIRAIHDPVAAGPLIELLTSSKEPLPLRLLYVDVLSQLGNPAVLPAFVRLTLEDREAAVRERCLDVLAKSQSKGAVRQFIKALKHDDNIIVNRAAVALGRMQDPEATPALIDALITTHKYVEGGGGMTPSFTGDGSAGLSMGGNQKVVKKSRQNESVLRALSTLNPGVNFSFDQVRWRAWYKVQFKPKSVGSLRRSE